MDSDKIKVKVTFNGPYEVYAEIPLDQAIIETNEEGVSERWGKGKKYDTKDETIGETYYLCRCGHSNKKPFCDETHKKIGFDGTETADNIPYCDSVKVYEGEAIDLLDKEALCAFARFCDAHDRAWQMTIMSGDAHPEYEKWAIEEACACPGGRLTVRKNGELIEPNLAKEISLIEDTASNRRGPLWVKGGIPVEGSEGIQYEIRNRIALCRCGDSSNKPFCDASHMRSKCMEGFDD